MTEIIVLQAVIISVVAVFAVWNGRHIERQRWTSAASRPVNVIERGAEYRVYEVCTLGAGASIERGTKWTPQPATINLPINFDAFVSGPSTRLTLRFVTANNRKYVVDGTINWAKDCPDRIPELLMDMANQVEALLYEDSQKGPR